jgi:hypothetical protein
MEPALLTKPQQASHRTAWWVSIGFNILLFVTVCALGLYAFMLNVDLGDIKRRLSKEVESREQTERYLVDTRNLLAQSQHELEQVRSQLDLRETEFQTVNAEKSRMPVVVGFRSSLMGKGMVAVIENTSDRYLSVVLVARNPTRSTARRFALELGPRASHSFGHMEGWQFSSGDELSLFHEDFSAIRLNVP